MVRRAIKQLFIPGDDLVRIRQAAILDPGKFIERPYKGKPVFWVPEEKSGRLLPFNMRYGQRKAYEIFQEERAKNKPVRLFFLKSRRIGLTSLFSCLGLIDAWAQPNRHVGIIAHNEFRAKDILRMCKVYEKNMPTEFRVPMSKDSSSGIRFQDNDSEIIIGTCAEPDKVRGGGLHWVQMSEPAHYHRWFRKVILEVATTIAPEPGTVGIMETTGAGRGSACHTHWLAGRANENIWRCEFLDWPSDPSCAIGFDDGRHRDNILDEMAEIEPRLMEKFRFYKLTPEQMHWAYRDAYLYRCEQNYEYFCREFPMDEEEAWDAAGISFFGDNEIAAMQNRVEDPILFTFHGRFINQIFKDFSSLQRVKKVEDNLGSLVIKLWDLPVPGRRYIHGADCSLGEAGGNFSAGYIIDAQTRKMMCGYRGRIRPDEHAYVIASLGSIYNEALVGPEVNPGGGGMQTLGDLQRLGYYNIYIWRLRDDKRGIILSQKLGMVTNQLTRPLMLNELRKVFTDAARNRFPDPGIFRDKQVLIEMRTFQKDPETGRIEAAEDAYDDCILGLSIAHLIAADEIHGSNAHDLYGTYGKAAGDSAPFEKLLNHYEQIMTLPDPTDSIKFLSDTNFDLNDGNVNWHD